MLAGEWPIPHEEQEGVGRRIRWRSAVVVRASSIIAGAEKANALPASVECTISLVMRR